MKQWKRQNGWQRTIIADIYLYSSTKMEEAIKKNTVYAEFASDIKEGTKLYNGRVSQEVKNKGDFFREAIENFIENKKKNHKNLKKIENTRKNPIKRDFKP